MSCFFNFLQSVTTTRGYAGLWGGDISANWFRILKRHMIIDLQQTGYFRHGNLPQDVKYKITHTHAYIYYALILWRCATLRLYPISRTYKESKFKYYALKSKFDTVLQRIFGSRNQSNRKVGFVFYTEIVVEGICVKKSTYSSKNCKSEKQRKNIIFT
jgi:hypothetical protein